MHQSLCILTYLFLFCSFCRTYEYLLIVMLLLLPKKFSSTSKSMAVKRDELSWVSLVMMFQKLWKTSVRFVLVKRVSEYLESLFTTRDQDSTVSVSLFIYIFIYLYQIYNNDMSMFSRYDVSRHHYSFLPSFCVVYRLF